MKRRTRLTSNSSTKLLNRPVELPQISYSSPIQLLVKLKTPDEHPIELVLRFKVFRV